MQHSSDDNSHAPARLAPAAWLAFALAFLLSALVGAAAPTAIDAAALPPASTASDTTAAAPFAVPVADTLPLGPTAAACGEASLAGGHGSRLDEPQDECVARFVDAVTWEPTLAIVARTARRDRSAAASMWWMAAAPRAPPVRRAQDCSRCAAVAMATVHG